MGAMKRRSDMTERERRVHDRKATESMLAGTHLVPTELCLKCGNPAWIRSGTLTAAHEQCSGTAMVDIIAECRDKSCGHVAVQAFDGLGRGIEWVFGRAPVAIVAGTPYRIGMRSVVLSEKQRGRMQESLRTTLAV
jgi:hypothetical protein